MPPAARKLSRPRIASSSSVSRQSAEKPGATTATLRHALARQPRQHRRRSPARAIWRGRSATGRSTIELAAERLARAAARSSGNGNDRDRRARSVRSRHAVEARRAAPRARNRARPAPPRPMSLQRADIGRIVVIGRQRAQRRLPAHRRQRGERRVVGGRGRRRAILRVERREQDALAARILQRPQPLADRRPAVAHRMIDHARSARTRSCSASACARGDRGERRAVLGPHLRIGMRRLLRPGVSMMPRRIGCQAIGGISTTRRSDRNSAR